MLAARLTGLRLARPLGHPHAVLASALGLALAADYVYRNQDGGVRVVVVAYGVVGIALLNAWRFQDRLRLRGVLAIALAFQLGLVLLHIATDQHADYDSRVVYGPQGQSLLNGDYPASEYPLGAVLLFGFEALLGGGDAERPNAFLMIPFQLLLAAAVWRSNHRLAPWLATTAVVWPANAYWWEFRYDLVPAALLALGLVLAVRERWGWAGLALALGAFFKWTPGLTLVALAAWLLVHRRRQDLRRLLIGTLLVVLVHVPFAILAGGDLAAAYTRQGTRSITAESVWYLPLHVLGIVDFPGRVSAEVGAPGWADNAAIIVQGVALLTLLVMAAVAARLDTAIVLAAMMPVAFFVTNRIFSPQFILVMIAAWAIAVAVLARTRREQLVIGAAMLAAASLNVFVYPYALPYSEVTWQLSSLGLFAISIAVTSWVVVRAIRIDRR